MQPMELLQGVIGIEVRKLSKKENVVLEAELFIRVCDIIKEIFRKKNKYYFGVAKFNNKMENAMLDANFLRYMIHDILGSEEYSLEGIAYYTETPEEVICDVLSGRNTNPSLPLSWKIIGMHRTVRATLYREAWEKMVESYHKNKMPIKN